MKTIDGIPLVPGYYVACDRLRNNRVRVTAIRWDGSESNFEQIQTNGRNWYAFYEIRNWGLEWAEDQTTPLGPHLIVENPVLNTNQWYTLSMAFETRWMGNTTTDLTYVIES